MPGTYITTKGTPFESPPRCVTDEIKAYDKAIIITSDGDFDNLVKKLITVDKLDTVLAPSKRGCSHLLSSAARGRIAFLDELTGEIEKY